MRRLPGHIGGLLQGLSAGLGIVLGDRGREAFDLLIDGLDVVVDEFEFFCCGVPARHLGTPLGLEVQVCRARREPSRAFCDPFLPELGLERLFKRGEDAPKRP